MKNQLAADRDQIYNLEIMRPTLYLITLASYCAQNSQH